MSVFKSGNAKKPASLPSRKKSGLRSQRLQSFALKRFPGAYGGSTRRPIRRGLRSRHGRGAAARTRRRPARFGGKPARAGRESRVRSRASGPEAGESSQRAAPGNRGVESPGQSFSVVRSFRRPGRDMRAYSRTYTKNEIMFEVYSESAGMKSEIYMKSEFSKRQSDVQW